VRSQRHSGGEARASLPRDRRGNAQVSSRKAAVAQVSYAAEDSNEGAPEERPARGQRSRRGRRSPAAQDQDVAESQAEPVVLS
jgi:hypothetical protein